MKAALPINHAEAIFRAGRGLVVAFLPALLRFLRIALLVAGWQAAGQQVLPPAVLERTNDLGCLFSSDAMRLNFGSFTNANPWSPKSVIFDNLSFTTGDVGRRFVVTEADDPDFASLAAMLTNGQPDYLYCRVECGCIFLEGNLEPNLFGLPPAGGNGVDFAGFRIVSFELLLDHLSFSTQGSWTDTSYQFRIFLNYEALPPSILTAPMSQTAEEGSNVVFVVRADGSPPLSFSWVLNGTNTLTASTTNRTLYLTNLQASGIGAYTVVVTNLWGATTSSPALLNVIPPVERKTVAGLKITGGPGALAHLEYAAALTRSPNWVAFAELNLTSAPQWCFETGPIVSARFYRARQTSSSGEPPVLELHLIPAITLGAPIGTSVRVDYIHQFGPTDAWVTLATVTITDTSQLYFDTTAIGQPARLYRLVPSP